MLLDRHRLLDVVTGGDIAELEKRDRCIHLARVACPPADNSELNPWTKQCHAT